MLTTAGSSCGREVPTVGYGIAPVLKCLFAHLFHWHVSLFGQSGYIKQQLIHKGPTLAGMLSKQQQQQGLLLPGLAASL